MQILMAGMHDLNNQFGRALRRYPGVDVIHTNPDPGDFPRDADAVVIVKCQLSHQKFWDVKEAYKGRPMFITDLSFSPIKERLEKFLETEGLRIPRKDGVMAHAFKAAMNPTIPRAPLKPKEEPVTERKASMGSPKHTKEMLEKIHQTIIDCTNAGMSVREVAEFLEHEGLKKASGEPYRSKDIENIKFHLRKDGRLPQLGEKPKTPTRAPSPRASSSVADQQLELIGKVMKSLVSPQTKIELVEKIQRGEIISEETPMATKIDTDIGPRLRVQVRSIWNTEAKPLMTIDKFQAVAILKLFPEIKKFADE